MSGEIRRQEDPLLRQLLESAQLDEAPEGAEEAMLAALGLGTAGVATALVSTTKLGATSSASTGLASTTVASGGALPVASTLLKIAPLAAKMLGVLGVLGIGAVAWHQQRPATEAPPRGSEPPAPIRPSMIPPASHPLAAHVEMPTIPKAPAPRLDAPRAAQPSAAHDPAAASLPAAEPARDPGVSLELETRLLAAARNALALGDKATAREYLRQYEREVQDGVLQREADILWNRAR